MTETDTKKPVRIFFALWPNDEERAALAAWQAPLQKLVGGRQTPADKLHNTLVFLGDVEPDRLEALQLAAQEVSAAEFQIVFDVARYWGHNHIVYAAPGSVPPKLGQLLSKLEQRLLHHHFRFDRRSYKPHVTLLRHAHWSDSPLTAVPQAVWKMREFVLVQSVSEGEGTRYEVLARFPLNP
ncbi:MAG TPA: RNA 2',3'-cyclic phosphodiesterase [Gallionellaceae bacterium]|nr:RNA 2',3'-cyclic phosphodiesterase [Gallionellaceae bacterium]